MNQQARNFRGLTLVAWVLGVFLLAAPALTAAPGEIWIIYRAAIPIFGAMGEVFLKNEHWKTTLCPLETISNNFLEDHPPTLIIALGDSGVRRALALSWDVPIITAFVDQPPQDRRALFFSLHPPHSQQIEIFRRLSGTVKHIFFPYASESQAPCQELSDFVQGQQLDLQVEKLNDPRLWPKFFGKLSSPDSVVLLPVDPQLMNSAFLNGLMLESFRKQIPVIGFSEALVQQGALFALSLSPEKVAKELVLFANDLLNKGNIPGNRFRNFEHWDLYLNNTVGRKLGITFPKEMLDSARKVF